MDKGYKYYIKSGAGDSLSITFDQFAWDMDRGRLIYGSSANTHGAVITQGYQGHFNGCVHLDELKEFIAGLDEGINEHHGNNTLMIYTGPGADDGFPSGDKHDSLSFEMISPYQVCIAGDISTFTEEDQPWAKMSFRFLLDIEIIKDSMWDLRTIHQIFEQQYLSSRGPDPTSFIKLKWRTQEFVRRLKWRTRDYIMQLYWRIRFGR
jgi:hypothetical protein